MWYLSQVCNVGSNMQKSINVIYHIDALNKKNHMIISMQKKKH